jgi:RNA polymerase sigma-70 factor (ECF subfamily)
MQDAPDPKASLGDIPTSWTLLHVAHQQSLSKAGDARKILALRYNAGIRRFLGVLLRDDNEADEVAQEVQVRLISGAFRQANPEKGRFRDLLAVAVRNLAWNHLAKKQRHAGKAADLEQVASPDTPHDGADGLLIQSWRQSLLDMTWASLQEYERNHPGSVAWTLLRLRAENPDEDSEQLAARLSKATGRRIRADATRQQLRRARVRFAELLLEELAWSLDEPTPDKVEEELVELGLMEYVRDFLPPDWRERGELRG